MISQRSNSHTRPSLRLLSQIKNVDAEDYCWLISWVLTGARFLATCLHCTQFSSSSCSPFLLSLLSWYANSCFRLTKLFSVSVYTRHISALSKISIYIFFQILSMFYISSPDTRDHLCSLLAIGDRHSSSSNTQRDLAVDMFTGWADSFQDVACVSIDVTSVQLRDVTSPTRRETNERMAKANAHR